jgi:hypothetical protein
MHQQEKQQLRQELATLALATQEKDMLVLALTKALKEARQRSEDLAVMVADLQAQMSNQQQQLADLAASATASATAAAIVAAANTAEHASALPNNFVKAKEGLLLLGGSGVTNGVPALAAAMALARSNTAVNAGEHNLLPPTSSSSSVSSRLVPLKLESSKNQRRPMSAAAPHSQQHQQQRERLTLLSSSSAPKASPVIRPSPAGAAMGGRRARKGDKKVSRGGGESFDVGTRGNQQKESGGSGGVSGVREVLHKSFLLQDNTAPNSRGGSNGGRGSRGGGGEVALSSAEHQEASGRKEEANNKGVNGGVGRQRSAAGRWARPGFAAASVQNGQGNATAVAASNGGNVVSGGHDPLEAFGVGEQGDCLPPPRHNYGGDFLKPAATTKTSPSKQERQKEQQHQQKGKQTTAANNPALNKSKSQVALVHCNSSNGVDSGEKASLVLLQQKQHELHSKAVGVLSARLRKEVKGSTNAAAAAAAAEITGPSGRGKKKALGPSS